MHPIKKYILTHFPKVMNIYKNINDYRKYILHKNGNNISGRVESVNICVDHIPWIASFINHNFPKQVKEPDIRLISVFGPRFLINCNKKTIFYSGENLHNTHYWDKYADACLDYVDLSIGFDYLNHSKYCRIPYWIITHFPYDATEKTIADKIKTLNEAKFPKTKDCALIARDCINGLRTEIYNNLKDTLNIECPSRLFHNTNDLKTKFNDNKLAYLQQFKFNICPENSNDTGYVTEKIFDAFAAGCIPIYYGSDNNPEPNIINHKAVLFWNFKGDNSDTIKKIKLLSTNNDAYEEFISQNKLTSEANMYIQQLYKRLRDKLARICQ
ncbi:MAG: hypothetical protein IKP67_09495 [Spirochaetales bacterium]|nr:hypothetical protein [Spirochaetales bacterium]